MSDENDQTRDRWLDFRRMQVASDQVTFLVESSDDITQDSEVFVPVRIILECEPDKIKQSRLRMLRAIGVLDPGCDSEYLLRYWVESGQSYHFLDWYSPNS